MEKRDSSKRHGADQQERERGEQESRAWVSPKQRG
jgi:hypothetical protein